MVKQYLEEQSATLAQAVIHHGLDMSKEVQQEIADETRLTKQQIRRRMYQRRTNPGRSQNRKTLREAENRTEKDGAEKKAAPSGMLLEGGSTAGNSTAADNTVERSSTFYTQRMAKRKVVEMDDENTRKEAYLREDAAFPKAQESPEPPQIISPAHSLIPVKVTSVEERVRDDFQEYTDQENNLKKLEMEASLLRMNYKYVAVPVGASLPDLTRPDPLKHLLTTYHRRQRMPRQLTTQLEDSTVHSKNDRALPKNRQKLLAPCYEARNIEDIRALNIAEEKRKNPVLKALCKCAQLDMEEAELEEDQHDDEFEENSGKDASLQKLKPRQTCMWCV
ncbi:hypothetical protein BJ878DRAFT_555628 [Calycina marina]|uniref:Uncharacterized protein n=1 Tax=Calycina marina TaxID=1763456 RepID=A0A9P7YYN3_9HELO|nr:hypothetical protein BJ878DRAFT_555628 [Calycina marina]